MGKLCNSTRLMNILIGLSFPNPQFQPILHKIGYQLEYIEPHFTNLSGKLVNPDLQFKSNADKALVFFECKSGAIEHEQAQKYKDLTISDIIQNNITSLDMNNSIFDIIYFCDESNRNKVLKGEEINNYGFSILCCNKNSIIVEKDRIKGNVLKNTLNTPISIPDHMPTDFYPYGPDDKKDYVAPSIFQSLLRLAGIGKQNISIEDILKDSHPYYNSIHPKGQKKLKELVGKIMNDIEQNDFVDVIKRLKNPERFRISPRSFKTFRDLCLKYKKKYENERSQLSISNYL